MDTLVAFREAALAKDWPLAWSAAPVLPEWAVPPQFTWPWLGLRSPPLYETVSKHLHQVGLVPITGSDVPLLMYEPQQ